MSSMRRVAVLVAVVVCAWLLLPRARLGCVQSDVAGSAPSGGGSRPPELAPPPMQSSAREFVPDESRIGLGDLDASSLRDKLRKREIRWQDLDDAQSLAVGRLMGREVYGTLSPRQQRDHISSFVGSGLSVGDAALNDVDRSYFDLLNKAYLDEAVPVAESAVALIADDIRSAWDSSDGLLIWNDQGEEPTVVPTCDPSGHVRHECIGALAPGYQFRFAYSSTQNPTAQAALGDVKEMRRRYQRMWGEYVSTR